MKQESRRTSIGSLQLVELLSDDVFSGQTAKVVSRKWIQISGVRTNGKLLLRLRWLLGRNPAQQSHSSSVERRALTGELSLACT